MVQNPKDPQLPKKSAPLPGDNDGGPSDAYLSNLEASFDSAFDTIGFDFNPAELEQQSSSSLSDTSLSTSLSDTSITNAAFSGNFGGFADDAEDDSHQLPPPATLSTAQQLATIMAEFGFQVPEEEPDLAALQAGLVGIDLGSSDAVVSCFDRNGKAIVVANSVAERTTPARLLLDENDDWLIGREARSLAPSNPDCDFGDLKSLFLMNGWSTDLRNKSYSASDLLGIFLRKLVEDIGDDSFGFSPTHVALAAPVWFGADQRAALSAAVASAGFQVVGVTDELLAACVPYSLRLPDLRSRKAVVVDVGHRGTSMAFIDCAGGDLNIICQAGLPDLGAVNWDELLIAESVRKFTKHHGFDPRVDATCMIDLNSRVEEAKKALSSRRSYIMPIQSEGQTLKVRFEREAFERASATLLGRLRAFLNRVLQRSEVEGWDDFDALVISGGGGRIPMVKALIEECVGRPAEPFNAEENVAIGTLYWGMSARHQANKAAEAQAKEKGEAPKGGKAKKGGKPGSKPPGELDPYS